MHGVCVCMVYVGVCVFSCIHNTHIHYVYVCMVYACLFRHASCRHIHINVCVQVYAYTIHTNIHCTCMNGLCMVNAYGECIGTDAGFKWHLHSVVFRVIEVTSS